MGIICARFSLYWSVLALLDLVYIQPLVDKLYLNYLVPAMGLIIGMYMCVDLFLTLKESWNLSLRIKG